MTRRNKKAWLAAGLLAGAAALTGCAAAPAPSAAPTPQAAQKITAQPDTQQATASPSESPQAEETDGPLALSVDGEKLSADAMLEEDGLLLPLEETAAALGWTVSGEEKEEESLTRKSVSLQKDDSRITVSWTVSDNTTKGVTWQKDGLLIPVDARLTTMDGRVYVPAAFFETAMRVTVEKQGEAVQVTAPAPQETPENDAQQDENSPGKNNS